MLHANRTYFWDISNPTFSCTIDLVYLLIFHLIKASPETYTHQIPLALLEKILRAIFPNFQIFSKCRKGNSAFWEIVRSLFKIWCLSPQPIFKYTITQACKFAPGDGVALLFASLRNTSLTARHVLYVVFQQNKLPCHEKTEPSTTPATLNTIMGPFHSSYDAF